VNAEKSCGLCLENPISATRLHPYGVKLCESCARGLMDDYIGLRGIQLTSKVVHVRGGDSGDHVEHTVRAKIPSLLGSFSFHKRTLTRKLLELLTRPRRVGDPIFDDVVTASGRPAEMLARALSNDGFQTAVLEMALKTDFTVVRGELKWVYDAPIADEPLVRETRRNAAIVLHHLEEAARG
jgi:hypothetical protein